MTTKTIEYRVKFNDTDLFHDVSYHLVRWVLLTVVTLGLALIVYPFYLVRFIADRISIVTSYEIDSQPYSSEPYVKPSTPAEKFLNDDPAPKAAARGMAQLGEEEQPPESESERIHRERIEDAHRRHHAHLVDIERDFQEAQKQEGETALTRESVESLQKTLREQTGHPPPEREVTSPPPVHVRLFTFTNPAEQPYRGTWTIPTGESGPAGNSVTQPLDGYLDEEMKAGYVLTSMGFAPDSKDLCVVTEYYPIKADERQGYTFKPLVVNLKKGTLHDLQSAA